MIFYVDQFEAELQLKKINVSYEYTRQKILVLYRRNGITNIFFRFNNAIFYALKH